MMAAAAAVDGDGAMPAAAVPRRLWLRGSSGSTSLAALQERLSAVALAPFDVALSPAASASRSRGSSVAAPAPAPAPAPHPGAPPPLLATEPRDRSVVRMVGSGGAASTGSTPLARLHAGMARTVDTAMQLDAIQSELLARSLRMRNETAAYIMTLVASRRGDGAVSSGSSTAAAASRRRARRRGGADGADAASTEVSGIDLHATATSVISRHAVAFGQSRERESGSLDMAFHATAAGSTTSLLLPGSVPCKDGRLLPSLRRDFSRALSLAVDVPGGVASSEAYVAQLGEAVRLLREARTTLHSVVADSIYAVVEAIDTVLRRAVRTPTAIVAARPEDTASVTSPGSTSSGRGVAVENLVTAFFVNVTPALHAPILRAVANEAGEAMRLLLRVRAFLAQLQNRYEQLEETLVSAGLSHHLASPAASSPFGRPGGGFPPMPSAWSSPGGGADRALAAVSPRAAAAPAPHGRRGSVGGTSVFSAGDGTVGRDDENPLARLATSLAREDAGMVEGEFARVWDFRRLRHPSDKEDEEPVVDSGPTGHSSGMVIEVRPLGGMRSPRAPARDDGALSPRSPLMSPHASCLTGPLPMSKVAPVFDPRFPAPPPDIPLLADVAGFLRHDHCLPSLLACPVPNAPPVADEDALLSAEALAGAEGGADGMSAMVLEHNVAPAAAKTAMTQALWLMWRQCLVLYAECQRERMRAGMRDVWTTVIAPPRTAGGAGASGGTRSGSAGDRRAAGATTAAAWSDLSRASRGRRLLDAQLASVVYRLLEAAAVPHLYPMA